MNLSPVLCDFPACANPHTIARGDVIEKLDEPRATQQVLPSNPPGLFSIEDVRF
jgi:hypothetical protein